MIITNAINSINIIQLGVNVYSVDSRLCSTGGNIFVDGLDDRE